MEKDEHKERVKEAMQRFYQAQEMAGIHWPLVCVKCPCKRRRKIMCETKNGGENNGH